MHNCWEIRLRNWFLTVGAFPCGRHRWIKIETPYTASLQMVIPIYAVRRYIWVEKYLDGFLSIPR